MKTTDQIVRRAAELGVALPSFRLSHLPMAEPLIRAVVAEGSFALLAVCPGDLSGPGAHGIEEAAEEFRKHGRPDCVRLHLDDMPVTGGEGRGMDCLTEIRRAMAAGYGSVMVDGSLLPLEERILATREAADIAHGAGLACEAELGPALGLGAGPLPSYEELFSSGRAFTRPEEAGRFVRESGCDWLSVAVGNLIGALSGAGRDRHRGEARLDMERLEAIRRLTGVPLVLRGGSGVRRADVLDSMKHGIAKIDVDAEIRETWEHAFRRAESTEAAQEAVYERARLLIRDYFGLSGIGSGLLA